MMELILAGCILILMVGFLMLDHRQFEERLKQSYDQGFRDGLTMFAKDSRMTVGERLEQLGNEKD